MSGCSFCAIATGDGPAHVVDEDDATISFLDIFPFTRGHTLVIPKRHATDLWELDGEEAAAVMRAGHRVAERLRAALEPEGLNLLQSNGAVAFQTVFHMHLHVMPRWRSDALTVPPWPKPPADQAELAALADRIRAHA